MTMNKEEMWSRSAYTSTQSTTCTSARTHTYTIDDSHVEHCTPTWLLNMAHTCCMHQSGMTLPAVASQASAGSGPSKAQIGNQGQRVDFLGCRHVSTSGFASTATETAVFALFLPAQPSDWY